VIQMNFRKHIYRVSKTSDTFRSSRGESGINPALLISTSMRPCFS